MSGDSQARDPGPDAGGAPVAARQPNRTTGSSGISSATALARGQTGLPSFIASRDRFDSHHYCFRVSDAELYDIFDRVTATGIKYRSQLTGGRINTRLGERLTIRYVCPNPLP